MAQCILACLPDSDVILSGLVHLVDLDDDSKDGMGARRSFVHRGGANRAHLVPLVHEAVNALLITDDCLSQVLGKAGGERTKLRVEIQRRTG